MREVLEVLSQALRRTFCTYALFVCSRTAEELRAMKPYDLWWYHCWPVHQLPSVVRPRVIQRLCAAAAHHEGCATELNMELF